MHSFKSYKNKKLHYLKINYNYKYFSTIIYYNHYSQITKNDSLLIAYMYFNNLFNFSTNQHLILK